MGWLTSLGKTTGFGRASSSSDVGAHTTDNEAYSVSYGPDGELCASDNTGIVLAHPSVTHVGIGLVIDCSGSVDRHIGDINDAVARMIKGIQDDQVARFGVDLMVASVGGAVHVDQQLAPIERVSPPTLRAGGTTPLNQAILHVASELREYTHLMAAHGVSYRMPWLVVISDGFATDPEHEDVMISQVGEATRRGTSGHLAMWFIGTNNFNRAYAERLPTQRVLQLHDFDIRQCLNWIAENMRVLSHTDVGVAAQIAPLPRSMSIPPEWAV